MINIWATTCGPCIEEMPEPEEMNQEFRQKGKLLGNPIMGASPFEYEARMEEYLSQ
ncbi:MAG: hypothetical protein K5649_09710 [Lachnospiraceae bacterium]|nr:hypothetical protein [Lachnospiraceae bacterium]